MDTARRVEAIEFAHALADARTATPTFGKQMQTLLRAPRIDIAQCVGDRSNARVEEKAVDVGQFGAQRARKTQIEKAVRAHRTTHVEQQHQSRPHAAVLLPRDPERRAAAADAVTYRSLQIKSSAVVCLRFSAQLQLPQPAGEAP